MTDLSAAAHRAASRARWLAELEAALDHCDDLARALRTCPDDSREAQQIREEIALAKEEIDRIRRDRPRARSVGSRQFLQPKLATWRGNQVD